MVLQHFMHVLHIPGFCLLDIVRLPYFGDKIKPSFHIFSPCITSEYYLTVGHHCLLKSQDLQNVFSKTTLQ